MARPIDLNDLRLLMQVVDHGTFSAASRAIGIPKSTISQRISALERTVGTGLLRRTPRAFSLTETGALLLPHARALEQLARKLEREFLENGPEVGGTLRISCCNALGQFVLPQLVSRFLALHRHATIRVEATNRQVDLIGEGFDMAVRSHAGPLKDSSLLQRVVAISPWLLVAAPDWVQAHRMPGTPAKIPSEQVICFTTTRECPPLTLRRGDDEIVVRISPRLVFDDIATLHASALAADGMACLPAYIVGAELRSGHLLRVLPEWSLAPSTLSVLTPQRAQSSRLARTFSDFLAAELPRLMDG